MSYLILYLQTKNEIVDINKLKEIQTYNHLIYLRPINRDLKNKNIIIYNEFSFNFNLIKDEISKYDYILYLDDNWKSYQINLFLQKSLPVLKGNKDLDQVIFNDIQGDFIAIRFKGRLLQIPKTKNIIWDDYHLFKHMTDHNKILKNNSNPYSKTKELQIDHLNYFKGKLPILNFRLLPSLIRVNKLVWNHTIPLMKNDYLEYRYAEILEENKFKSCYYNKLNPIPNSSSSIICGNRNGENITIVTAYFELNIKRPPKRKTQVYDYIEKSKDTLSIRQNMIIFLTKNLISDVQQFRNNLGLEKQTNIIEISVEKDLYLFNELPKIRVNFEKNISPYNIPEFLLSVNSRYNLMKKAIELNYFNSDYYAWIDFSAGHIVDIPNHYKITYSKTDKIRISWIARMNKAQTHFKYNYKCCGGGVFIGHKDIMMELIKLHDIEFKHLAKLGYCINDDKLLFILFEKYPQLFDMYTCGYSRLLTKS